MRHYCLLIIRSNSEDAASSIFRPQAMDMLGFEDLRLEKHGASGALLRQASSSVQFVVRSDLPRYCWSLNSLKAIDQSVSDPLEHVSWLLSQLKRGISLADAQKQGIECVMALYWGGLGSGGGPLITPRLSSLLIQHDINLSIGFYV